MPFSSDIYVEKSVKGISKLASRKWRFTENTFTVRNPRKKTQTVYPITYDSQYIYLGSPIEVDSEIGVYDSKKIIYELGEHSILLCFDNDTYLNLVEQEYKNKVVNIATTSAFALTGTAGLSKGLFNTMVKKKAAASAAAAASTTAKTSSVGLLPNQTYNSNGNIFTTDNLGRVVSASGPVKLSNSQRNKNMTRTIGNLADLKSDDGGHLIGDALGGPSEAFNLVPMNSHLNRGEYEKLERELKNYVKNGHSVNVDIQPIYKDNGIRPSEIIYKYWVDGIEYFKTFLNDLCGGILWN